MAIHNIISYVSSVLGIFALAPSTGQILHAGANNVTKYIMLTFTGGDISINTVYP